MRSSFECRQHDGASPISDRELCGNVFVFLLAGHETTANSLAFTLANLALHSEAQQKVYEEITAIAGKGGDLVRYLAGSLAVTSRSRVDLLARDLAVLR